MHLQITRIRVITKLINAAVNALSIAAAYAVTVPLYRFFHSWRGTLLFWSLVSAAWMGIFILFDAAHAPAAAGAPSRAPASLAQAARLPKVWCMAAAMGGLTIDRQAEDDEEEQVDQHERRAAVLSRDVGEPPDVADPDGAARRDRSGRPPRSARPISRASPSGCGAGRRN